MSYNLVFVDVGFSVYKVPTIIHRMNVITGDYLTPVVYNYGDMNEQVDRLIDLLLKDRPDKIIFDKFGRSISFYDCFMERAKYSNKYRGLIEVDSFGLITYGG